MPGGDRWGDVLRVVGRWLDTEEAQNVQIAPGPTLDVTWQRAGTAQETALTRLDMDKLREQAPLMRQPISAPPKGDREELLRTLGQELDDLGYKVERVSERAAGYEVRVVGAEGPSDRFYSLPELREHSARRRALRGTQTSPEDKLTPR